MSSDGEGAKEKTNEEVINAEVDLIMQAMDTKGPEMPQNLKTLLEDKT